MGRQLDKFMIFENKDNLKEVCGHRFYTGFGDVGFFKLCSGSVSVWLAADLTTGLIEGISSNTYNGIVDKFFDVEYSEKYKENHKNGSLAELQEKYQLAYDKYLKDIFSEYGITF